MMKVLVAIFGARTQEVSVTKNTPQRLSETGSAPFGNVSFSRRCRNGVSVSAFQK